MIERGLVVRFRDFLGFVGVNGGGWGWMGVDGLTVNWASWDKLEPKAGNIWVGVLKSLFVFQGFQCRTEEKTESGWANKSVREVILTVREAILNSECRACFSATCNIRTTQCCPVKCSLMFWRWTDCASIPCSIPKGNCTAPWGSFTHAHASIARWGQHSNCILLCGSRQSTNLQSATSYTWWGESSEGLEELAGAMTNLCYSTQYTPHR